MIDVEKRYKMKPTENLQIILNLLDQLEEVYSDIDNFEFTDSNGEEVDINLMWLQVHGELQKRQEANYKEYLLLSQENNV